MSDHLPDPFSRLSDRIFLPLTGKGARQNWEIIHTIFGDFFAGDYVRAEPGVPKGDVTDTIERVIRYMPDYSIDDGEIGPSDSRQLSSRIYRYLVVTGWLAVEKENYVDIVYLEPSVSQLIAHIVEIAESKPTLLRLRKASQRTLAARF